MQKYKQLDIQSIAESCSRKHIYDIMKMMLTDLKVANVLVDHVLHDDQMKSIGLAVQFKELTK